MNSKLIAGLLITLMVSQLSFARGSTQNLAMDCLKVAQKLNETAQAHLGDLCSGDVQVAAAYAHAAGVSLSREKMEPASVSLVYAKNELNEISYNRSYCALLSSSIKPYLAEIIMIQGVLDAQRALPGVAKPE